MKVAYFAESPADEAALKVLTEAILGRQTERVIPSGLLHRGWPAVKNALRSIFLELHYHTDSEGLVVIVDSNGSPLHLPAHEQGGGHDAKCRLCELRRIIDEAISRARPRKDRSPLKIALGIAVPAIEAWLLCGVDPHVGEAAWANGLKNNQAPYTIDQLKTQLYGTPRPSLRCETEAMTTAALRLASDSAVLTERFPVGFGLLKRSLMAWQRP
ncbi:MAG: hypothetical protein ACRED1_09275 [Limisphaerales bacterium]